MTFDSFQFLLFFPIVTIIYFTLPFRWRWFFLLVASSVFYMAFVPIYILILAATIIVDYGAGILIEKSYGHRRKVFLIASLVTNIGFLAFFKYYGFAAANVNLLSSFFHLSFSLPLLHILLPIGLSFHTFQAMSYTIEVYRGKQPAERHFGLYALYVMFYPQLVAGPIERPQNLLHQFREPHSFDYSRVILGLKQMLMGFFKKIVIANRAAYVVSLIYADPTTYGGGALMVATFLFAWQIYYDFSGYSDIALGAARVMGFELMNNFGRPYFSRSIAEFWRRWHISLSIWLRDYLYIPLGGSRVSFGRWCFNTAVVFLICGLWHGANWTFLIWGGLQALYLIVGRLTAPTREKLFVVKTVWGRRVHALFQYVSVFLFISFSWIFFRAPDTHTAIRIVQRIFSLESITLAGMKSSYTGLLHAGLSVGSLGILCMSIVIIEITQAKKFFWHATYAKNAHRYQSYLWAYVLIFSILLFGLFGTQPFIYFQF